MVNQLAHFIFSMNPIFGFVGIVLILIAVYRSLCASGSVIGRDMYILAGTIIMSWPIILFPTVFLFEMVVFGPPVFSFFNYWIKGLVMNYFFPVMGYWMFIGGIVAAIPVIKESRSKDV